jgi:NAD(P)-dependent dehydrogenase (short-subunit alcohol dehydrogenase family)
VRRPEATEAPAGALVHPADAAHPASAAAWVAATVAAFGRIDALVCNAGLMIPRDVISATEDDMAAMFAVNVHAPQRLARAAWPYLRASGRGRVIIIGSLSGLRVASATSGAYAVTKFAAVALAHALRHAGWEDGIRATAICPGFVNTDMAAAITDTPPERMTQPAEVARLVELALDLPNTASVAELAVSARAEGRF